MDEPGNEDSNLSVAGSVEVPPSVASGDSSNPDNGSEITAGTSDIVNEESGKGGSADSAESADQQPQTPAARVNNRLISADVTHRAVQPEDVIEYEWPAKSNEKWFLQEQIGELLDIKSFSRKYPDLTRRKLSIEERDFLINTFNIQNLLNETQLRDLAAMRAVEIHDMMGSEYPQIYQEYQKATSAREKALMAEKAREMEAIKNDSKKLAELREKAIRNAVEFNKELQHARRTERAFFWDIQTNVIQSRSNTWKKLSPAATRPHPYPVALVPGQYQNYYRRYTREEMMRLPLNTIVDGAHLYPVHREMSPPPIHLDEDEIGVTSDQPPTVTVKQELTTLLATPKASDHPTRKSSLLATGSVPLKCDTCAESVGNGQVIKCAACGSSAHVECLEMSNEMAEVVKTYEWNCVDCRKCTVCNQPDQEEQIMFCDRCDRGYHTYCVGLKEPPSGSWFCPNFCNVEQQPPKRPMRASRTSSRRPSAY